MPPQPSVTQTKTDEDCEKIRIGGTTIAEGVYLLKVARPFTPPGDENNSTGLDAVELSPAQILAKVKKDPVEWNARIEALRNVAVFGSHLCHSTPLALTHVQSPRPWLPVVATIAEEAKEEQEQVDEIEI